MEVVVVVTVIFPWTREGVHPQRKQKKWMWYSYLYFLGTVALLAVVLAVAFCFAEFIALSSSCRCKILFCCFFSFPRHCRFLKSHSAASFTLSFVAIFLLFFFSLYFWNSPLRVVGLQATEFHFLGVRRLLSNGRESFTE